MEDTDKRRARGQLRRELILRAAVAVIGRDGGGALTHRAAAHRARVSLASVTYHFPSAVDLSEATYRWAADRLLDRITDATAWQTIAPAALPETVAEICVELAREHRGELITVNHMALAAADDSALRSLSVEFRARSTGVLSEITDEVSGPVLLAALNGVLIYALNAPEVPSDWIRGAASTLVRKFAAAPDA